MDLGRAKWSHKGASGGKMEDRMDGTDVDGRDGRGRTGWTWTDGTDVDGRGRTGRTWTYGTDVDGTRTDGDGSLNCEISVCSKSQRLFEQTGAFRHIWPLLQDTRCGEPPQFVQKAGGFLNKQKFHNLSRDNLSR